MIKIITLVGARPQLIKASAISREIKKSFHNQIEEIIVHTGQHYDENMSNVFFQELEIPKEKYNLQVGSGSHAFQTANIMLKFEKILIDEKPDYLLLYGDTNSTIAAALTAAKIFIPIIHIEAGVRGYNKNFPEEINRILTDHLSTLLFTPTISGYESLEKEGFKFNEAKKISNNNPAYYLCGDIMYDNTLFFGQKMSRTYLEDKFNIKKSYCLLTMHRPSNVDDPRNLANILNAIIDISEKHDLDIIFPVHPRTKNVIEHLADKVLSNKILNHKNIKMLPPASFIEMIALEKYSEIVITDSGGVQKEAFFLERPCLIMLEETPWVELIDSGCAKLVGSDKELIKNEFDNFYVNADKLLYENLYGDGNSSNFILNKIVECNLLK